MSDPALPIAEEELHAWIDDQLDPAREPVVLRYLQEQPDVARPGRGIARPARGAACRIRVRWRPSRSRRASTWSS